MELPLSANLDDVASYRIEIKSIEALYIFRFDSLLDSLISEATEFGIERIRNSRQ